MSNLLVYTVSMSYERSLCVNDIIRQSQAQTFLSEQTKVFLDTNARYSRMAALLHAMLLLVAGPQALLYLFVSELAWQMPVIPPSPCSSAITPATPLPHLTGEACVSPPPVSTCIIRARLRSLFDLTCAFTNYHVEHHDFPEVPLWNLRQIRRRGPANSTTVLRAPRTRGQL